MATSEDRSLRITGNLYAAFAWHQAGALRRSTQAATRALELLEGEPLHRQHGHQALPIPTAHAQLARSLAELGEFDEALRHGENALRLAEKGGHPYTVNIACWSLAHLYRTKGDHEQAVRVVERNAAAERGAQWWRLAPLGYSYAAAGRIDEGTALLEQHRTTMEARGVAVFKARMLESLADAYLLGGRLHDAAVCADEALALARRRGERGVEAWVLRLHGEIASRCEPSALEPAAEHYRRALALAAEFGMRPLMAHCHWGLGRLYGRTNRRQGADHLRRARTLCREMGMAIARAADAQEVDDAHSVQHP